MKLIAAHGDAAAAEWDIMCLWLSERRQRGRLCSKAALEHLQYSTEPWVIRRAAQCVKVKTHMMTDQPVSAVAHIVSSLAQITEMKAQVDQFSLEYRPCAIP